MFTVYQDYELSKKNSLNYFNINDEKERNTVKKCIKTYGKHPVGFNILHRMVNAVKDLFGCSDWQKAEKIILPKVSKVLKDTAINSFGHKDLKQEFLQKRSQEITKFLLDYTVNEEYIKVDSTSFLSHFILNVSMLHAGMDQSMDKFITDFTQDLNIGSSPSDYKMAEEALKKEHASLEKVFKTFNDFVQNPALEFSPKLKQKFFKITKFMCDPIKHKTLSFLTQNPDFYWKNKEKITQAFQKGMEYDVPFIYHASILKPFPVDEKSPKDILERTNLYIKLQRKMQMQNEMMSHFLNEFKGK